MLKDSFLDRINATRVSPELLGDAIQMHAAMPPEDRKVHELRILRLIELLDEKGFRDQQHKDLAIAIDFRLQALARAVADQEARGWTIPAPNGAEFVHVDVLCVAAVEPMIEAGERHIAFDPVRFRAKLLEISAPLGRA